MSTDGNSPNSQMSGSLSPNPPNEATNPFVFNEQRTKSMILCMIDNEFIQKKAATKSRHQPLWDRLAEDLENQNGWKNLSGIAVKNKWNKLVSEYKKKKELSNKSGSSGEHTEWPFYDLMAQAMSTSVLRDPVAVTASTTTTPSSSPSTAEDCSGTSIGSEAPFILRFLKNCAKG
jgi:hypothetical protein